MKFNTIFKVITLTVVMVTIVYGLKTQKDIPARLFLRTSPTHLLDVEARRRKNHYFIHPYYGWHALTWIYWIKVKLVVVAFFAYTAFIWALRYMGTYNNKCADGGQHHVYYEHGHYRSFPALEKPISSLQTNRKERKKRSLRTSTIS